MTYLQFHLVFLLPVLVLLLLLHRSTGHWSNRRRHVAVVLGLALIALAYTTPWDNYLVWRQVWSYGPERVLATIGYVPLEEYLFFLLQPLLTGFWLLWLYRRRAAVAQDPVHIPKIRWTGTLIYAVAAGVGLWLLIRDQTHTEYLGLILVWSGPVLAAQWAYGAPWMWALRRIAVLGVIVPTVYLCLADRIAIGLGIWTISSLYSTGIHIFGLPIEEAIFFLVTNLLVVQGMILFLLPELRASHGAPDPALHRAGASSKSAG